VLSRTSLTTLPLNKTSRTFSESIEIVFYETNERTYVFNESFAKSFVAATTPFFHPDTDYGDYSAGSVFELANVNMPMDKAC
jgi:hypothetical protein